MSDVPSDRWREGAAYEAYMGRWSRPLANAFVAWLREAPGSHWLEVGCGTGALTAAICADGEPASVVACDPSASFVEHARAQLADPRVSFVVAGVDALPTRAGGFDAVASALVFNFLPDARAAVAAMRERLRPGGSLAACVWDYADGMELLRVFWDEAAAIDARAAALDEGARFPLCRASALASLFRECDLDDLRDDALAIATDFASFDDYWAPFLRGTGPAPSYVASLDAVGREALRARLERRLAPRAGAPVRLRARAWAVRGVAH